MERQRHHDLHTHSIYSDGTDDPKSLVRSLAQRGLEVFALTDHDTFAGYEIAKEEAEKWNLQIIPGVEVSTKVYHILGLNVRPDDEGFGKFLAEIRKNQLDGCAYKIEELQKHGIPISMEKLLATTLPGARIGKMNIIYAMMQDNACVEYALTVNPLVYPFDTFRQWFKGKGIATKAKKAPEADPCLAIEQIHKAGGIAILAHPFKQVRDMSELDYLRAHGLDGLEIQPNFGESNAMFKAYAQEHDLMVTHGSDFHGAGFGRPLLERRENVYTNRRLDEMLSKWRAQ